MLRRSTACLQPAEQDDTSSPASIALWQQEAIRLFNALTPMSDDDIKTSLCPPSFIKPTGTAGRLLCQHAYTAEEATMFSDLMRGSSPPTLRVITFYGEPRTGGKWQTCRLGYYAPFVPDTLSCSGTTRRKRSGANRARRLRCSHFRLPRGHYSRQLKPATRMKKISRPASQR